MAPKAAKELFKVRQRNALALADGRQGDRPFVLTQAKVNHGGHSKTSFGGEAHSKTSYFLSDLLKSLEYPSELLNL
jgi:hypothetical protein